MDERILFENFETEEDQKNYVWTNYIDGKDVTHWDYGSADKFWGDMPLSASDVYFYFQADGDLLAGVQDDRLKARFKKLDALTPDSDTKGLLAAYQRAFIKATNKAYQDPNESDEYLNTLDDIADDLSKIVSTVTNAKFDEIPQLVSDLNTKIKDAHKDRPIDKRQNAFNIAATIGYLAIGIACLALYFALPVVPMGLNIAISIVSLIAGSGFAHMAAKSYHGINPNKNAEFKKLGPFEYEKKGAHTLFTPKTAPLRNAKGITNIAKRKERGHRISEGLKNSAPKPKYQKI